MCGAEWLEGDIPVEPAYRYDDFDPFGLTGRYLTGRAQRFADYVTRVGISCGDILDVGCGMGHFLIASQRLGYRPVGTELDADVARAVSTRTGLPVLAGDITTSDILPVASFDAITAWGILEHVPDPERLLLACLRLLRPGGDILLETPNSRGAFRIVSRILMKLTQGRLSTPFRETLGAGHVVWYSGMALRATAHRLGLSVRDLRSSRNSTAILLARFAGLPSSERVPMQIATLALNNAAAPLGRPNQIMATLHYGGQKC